MVGNRALSLLYGIMSWNNSTCGHNCSGHGDCLNGTCICEIEFVGEECRLTNTSYFGGLAAVYLAVALVCLIQLVVCVAAEWHRLKAPSLLRACRVTTQKLLYFLVFLAATIRAAYFTSPNAFEQSWARSLMSAYYPLLLSGSSLIVCFWAEVFHLPDLRWQRRQFISKSTLGFIVFNVISYSLLIAEILTIYLFHSTPELESFYTHVFNGCYAVLLLIVVVFFLIYGVEVFFKVRGGFLLDEPPTNRPLSEEAARLFSYSFQDSPSAVPKAVDQSQLHQSRLGLLSQALMLLAVVVLLGSETFGEFWKSKVPIHGRNWHNLAFRIFELGVAVWFPCVLWNCMSPEQLWILNPKRLLKRRDYGWSGDLSGDKDTVPLEQDNRSASEGDCWICYDGTRTDAGELIQPCACKGDVKAVHHECLRKWLVESTGRNAPRMKCAVCNTDYRISLPGKVSFGKLMSAQHWVQTGFLTLTVAFCAGSSLAVVNITTNSVARVVVVGTMLLVLYVVVRFLCQNQIEAYQRARVAMVNIESNAPNVPTITDNVPQSSISKTDPLLRG